jgi:hypothetical protein
MSLSSAQVYSDVKGLQARRLTLIACNGLFSCAVAVNLYGASQGETQSGKAYYVLMAVLAGYLLLECRRHVRRHEAMGLLAPPFLASLLHFYLSYVLPSIGSLFDPWIFDRYAKYYTIQSEQFADVALMIFLAAFCMWRGYDFASSSGAAIRRKLKSARYLRADFEPAIAPVVLVQIGFFAIVSYAISIGVFGMAGSAEMRERNLELLEILNIGASGGTLSLFLLLVHLHRRQERGSLDGGLWVTCYILLGLHVLVGALSGFKSQIVMPFVLLAFAKFLATRTISLTYIGAAFVALFAAYQIIEPFRAYLGRDQSQGASSVSGVVEALSASQQQKHLMHETELSWGTQVVSRFDLTSMTVVGVAFAYSNPNAALKSAEFAESLYLALPYAFVPRALWPNKPIYASGVWFSNVVLGNLEDTTTSVAMGPIAWLYILGGSLGVAAGFFAIGLVQALIFEGFAKLGAGGFILFLSVAMPLATIPSDVGPVFIGMIRIMPIAFAAQTLLLRPAVR